MNTALLIKFGSLILGVSLAGPVVVASPGSDGDIMFYPRADELPFSEAVRVGKVLYLSGEIGVKPGTDELVEGGIRVEARQTMENIRATLGKYGYEMSDVVKCTVMLADISEWPAFNEVYREFFSERFPARSAFAGSGLALGARVEVECIAAKEPASKDS